MENYDIKCVIIIADDLPLGLVANAAAVMAITIGNKVPDILGVEAKDASGETHLGLVKIPVPCLKASRAQIKNIRTQAVLNSDLITVDFSEAALKARTDTAYLEGIAQQTSEQIEYIALALYGRKNVVTELTQKLSLLR